MWDLFSRTNTSIQSSFGFFSKWSEKYTIKKPMTKPEISQLRSSESIKL